MQNTTHEPTETQDERSITRAFALYPRHVAIIEALAKDDHRSLSNALQRIVEQWAEQNGTPQ